ncbi:MAG TPA: hypothetical protein VEZ18_23725 [Geodermatophilus sp.]|jgi:hypothetical protein|nr:hypothetical protein [Geodermatophilus sp.]
MQLRRPIAALLTALALFGGGATMTACSAAGSGEQSDGTTDTTDGDAPNTETNEESDPSQDNLPDLSDPEDGVEQGNGNDDSDDG